MHSDPADVKKSVRSYMIVFAMLMVFTVITVAVAGLNVSTPVAITIALIIATMKAAMVAGVFMHLSHERQAIYGTLLLTLVFFIVLMFVPILTVSDAITYGG
jgi:cytochrome c oxidase subunit 4